MASLQSELLLPTKIRIFNCRDISRYAIYRDIFDMQYGDTNVHGIRKYTKSHSADATSVGTHTHTFVFRCGAAYIYTVKYPPRSK